MKQVTVRGAAFTSAVGHEKTPKDMQLDKTESFEKVQTRWTGAVFL